MQFQNQVGFMPFEEMKARVYAEMGRREKDQMTLKHRIALEMAYRLVLIEQTGCCEKCGRTEQLTLDHIVPVALLLDFGIRADTFFDEENLALLCKWCNMFKSRKLDFTNPKTKILLVKYLSLIPDVISEKQEE